MLLIGYGNPGRGDDGLGPSFAERISDQDLPDMAVRQDYQLTVDHALRISQVNVVVFADALIASEAPFVFNAVEPGATSSLTSHSLTPQAVLGLCHTLYGQVPKAYVLGILGHEFSEVKEGLSTKAREGLDQAEAFFLDWFRQQS